MKLPEYYLIILAFLSGYTPPFSINPVAIGVVAIVILQVAFKNKISGLIISSIFLLVNLFMTGALFSELNEFQTFNADAKKLLFGGLLILGFNLLMSIMMISKYARKLGCTDYQMRYSS